MNAVATTLRAARRLIARKNAWAKGAHARAARGRRVHFDSPAAVRFDLTGALCAAVHRDKHLRLFPALDRLREAAGVERVGDLREFSDRVGHAAGLAAMDCAIELAERVHG